jgi:hypothetical protein
VKLGYELQELFLHARISTESVLKGQCDGGGGVDGGLNLGRKGGGALQLVREGGVGGMNRLTWVDDSGSCTITRCGGCQNHHEGVVEGGDDGIWVRKGAIPCRAGDLGREAWWDGW